jgi:4-carboxymuconolactone decarboxylase
MRLQDLSDDELTPRQRELAARIAGRRGKVRGPFLVWLRSPELCDKVEALGAFVRFESSLELRLRELILLIAARHWDAQYSWNAHVDKAAEAGIRRDALDAMAQRRPPEFDDREAQVVHAFCTELLGHHFVSDETFTAAHELFGDQGVVDIVGTLGNFSMLGMCLNAFEVDLQPGREPPFPDVNGYARTASAAGAT